MLEIAVFQKLNRAENIVVTQHSRRRMSERGILLRDVLSAIGCGEIIEQYPEDYPFPSCLILGCAEDGRFLHVVASIDDGFIYLITAYFPDSESWEEDLKTRKERRP